MFSRATGTGKRIPLKIKIGDNPLKESWKHGVAWIVWSTKQLPAAPILTPSCLQDRARVDTNTFKLYFTIQPSEIINDADRPNLSGGKEDNNGPPSVPAADTDVWHYGVDLKGGADRRWDVSRRIRRKLVNPGSINFNTGDYDCGCGCGLLLWKTYGTWPDEPVGNDDRHTSDPEDNNPYDTPDKGKCWAQDGLGDYIMHKDGAIGDTVELRKHFGQFLRLELGGNWHRVSPYQPWRIHFKFKKVNEAADNNDYNSDGDKTDKVWIDDGSFFASNNDGWD